MFRCELCDDYLSVFSFRRLCENCYRIRTITKCYNSNVIKSYLESVFLVEDENDTISHASNNDEIKERYKNVKGLDGDVIDKNKIEKEPLVKNLRSGKKYSDIVKE